MSIVPAWLGVASGMRSTVALAAVIARGSPNLPGPLRHRLAVPAAGVAVAVELVLDKLPTTPSRLDPVGLIGRAGFAAGAAALHARGAHRRAATDAAVAAVTALITAKVAHDVRAAAGRRVPDLVAAVVEDGLALGIAALASRA